MSWPKWDRDTRRKARGERAHFSRLTADDVLLIRAAYASGGISYPKLAEKFGVSALSIAKVVRRETWGHV